VSSSLFTLIVRSPVVEFRFAIPFGLAVHDVSLKTFGFLSVAGSLLNVGFLSVSGSLLIIGFRSRGGTLGQVGFLMLDGSPIHFGFLWNLGSLFALGFLTQHGSLDDLGFLSHSGSLLGVGFLVCVGLFLPFFRESGEGTNVRHRDIGTGRDIPKGICPAVPVKCPRDIFHFVPPCPTCPVSQTTSS
jgi:hypothetical protein